MDEQLIAAVIARTAASHGDRPALQHKVDGKWIPTSWSAYHDGIRQVARAFLHLGLEPGGGVVIVGFNRPEWFYANMAAIFAGGVATGIYTTSTAEQYEYIARNCGAVLAVVENREYLETLLSVRPNLPDLQAVVLMEGEASEPGVLSWSTLLELAEQTSEDELDRRIAAQSRDDLCTLIYTSGTTGDPKGVMLSQHNIVWTARAVAEAYSLAPGERVLSYLPLSHIAEQMVSLHGVVPVGACSWFAESLEQVGANLREARPHVFFGVPRIWEKIQGAVQAKAAANTGLKKRLAAWARRKGLAAGYAVQRGERMPAGAALAKRLVFDRVREALGLDSARICASGAAPLALDTQEFFLSLGIPILEVYGLSECCGPAVFSYPDRYKCGAAGLPIPGTEIRIAAEGEVHIRGPHVFLGYYRNPQATSETLDVEGWLHSGDVGRLDEDGFLWITDRMKELIVTSGGKNIAPQRIEARLKGIPGIGQAAVVGDRRNYLIALLTIDPDQLPAAAARAGTEVSGPEEASASTEFKTFIEGQVEDLNRDLARYETIKKIALLPNEFSVAKGELTPTMKLKRRIIEEHYAAEIEALYGGEAGVGG